MIRETFKPLVMSYQTLAGEVIGGIRRTINVSDPEKAGTLTFQTRSGLERRELNVHKDCPIIIDPTRHYIDAALVRESNSNPEPAILTSRCFPSCPLQKKCASYTKATEIIGREPDHELFNEIMKEP